METFLKERPEYRISAFKSYYVVWKHIQDKQNTKYELWFKSYYVVWKRYLTSNLGAYQKCLNRTMQYGNLFTQSTQGKRQIEFKSYYVVWKLQIGEKFARILSWFKSYYVVWKLNNKINKTTMQNSLNRTMQYGNIIFLFFFIIFINV